jgi:hypothetical protein
MIENLFVAAQILHQRVLLRALLHKNFFLFGGDISALESLGWFVSYVEKEFLVLADGSTQNS